MNWLTKLVLAFLGLVCVASVAAAQTPTLRYTVSGVTKVANLETAFSCTFTEPANPLTLWPGHL